MCKKSAQEPKTYQPLHRVPPDRGFSASSPPSCVTGELYGYLAESSTGTPWQHPMHRLLCICTSEWVISNRSASNFPIETLAGRIKSTREQTPGPPASQLSPMPKTIQQSFLVLEHWTTSRCLESPLAMEQSLS